MHSKVKTVTTQAHLGPLTPRALRSGGPPPPRAPRDTGHHHRDSASCPTEMTPPRGPQRKRTSLPNACARLAHQRTLTSGPSSGQLAEERPCLVRPSSSHFNSNDHVLCPPSWSKEFGVRSFRLPPCGCWCYPVVFGSSATWPAVTVQRTHHRRVHCQLSPSPKRQSIHHHLQPSAVVDIRCGRSMSRTMTLVRTLPCASLQILAKMLSSAKHQLDGHIGTNVHTEEELDGGASTRSLGRGETATLFPGLSEEQTARPLIRLHPAT